jgi:hypothetical protein
MKAYGSMNAQLHTFWHSDIHVYGGEWSASSTAGTYWTGSWVGHRVCTEVRKIRTLPIPKGNQTTFPSSFSPHIVANATAAGTQTLLQNSSWNVMAHAQKPVFVFRRNRLVHLKRRWCQFSRLLAAEVCASAVVMLDTPCSEVMWRVLATHSIRQFPQHFPSRASPCAITFQLEFTTDWHCGNVTALAQESLAVLARSRRRLKNGC